VGSLCHLALIAFGCGTRAGDSGLMRRAFLESARIHGTYDAKPVDWTLREFCDVIDKGGPAAGLESRVGGGLSQGRELRKCRGDCCAHDQSGAPDKGAAGHFLLHVRPAAVTG
jgi:hypothetical protein